MLFNLIVPLLTDLFRSKPFHSAQSNESLLMLKQAVRKEVGAQVIKIFTGLILTSVIIICLAKVFSALYIYIEQFQNSQTIQIITFGAIALVCGGLLALIFMEGGFKKKTPEPVEAPNHFDLQSLFLKFAEGVVQGYEKNRPVKE